MLLMSQSLRDQLLFKIDAANLPVRAEQIRARLRSYPRMVALRAIITLFVAGLLWLGLSHVVLLTWVAILFVLYAAESFYVWRYGRDTHSLAECLTWRTRLLVFVYLIAGTWGIGAMVLFVPGDMVYQAILILVVLGVAAGAATTNPVFPPALYIFVTLVILPIILANAWMADYLHSMLAALLVLFWLYVLGSGKILAETFELSLRQALENLRLVQQLRLEKQRAELAQQQAELANLAKSKFLAAASHDLRQPMHALTMFVEALKPHVHGEQGAELMNQVATSAEVLAEMFDSLLDMSRLDTGAIAPNLQRFPVQQVLDRIQPEFAWLAQEKELAFSVEQCATEVYSDPLLLERMLRNLFANAIRYTARGEVVVRCKPDGASLRIEVRDSGIGISGAHLPHIFEEYYQVGNRQRDRHNGLGLGLAIVWRLAHLLNCEVRVTSETGMGSCFSLSIPLSRSDDMIGGTV